MKRNAHSFQPQLKVDCYHIAQAPKLFVRKVDLLDLMKRWIPHHQGQTLPKDDAYYIECQRHGLINWKDAQVYTLSQLVGRNNVFVVKFH